MPAASSPRAASVVTGEETAGRLRHRARHVSQSQLAAPTAHRAGIDSLGLGGSAMCEMCFSFLVRECHVLTSVPIKTHRIAPI